MATHPPHFPDPSSPTGCTGRSAPAARPARPPRRSQDRLTNTLLTRLLPRPNFAPCAYASWRGLDQNGPPVSIAASHCRSELLLGPLKPSEDTRQDICNYIQPSTSVNGSRAEPTALCGLVAVIASSIGPSQTDAAQLTRSDGLMRVRNRSIEQMLIKRADGCINYC